MCRSSGDVGLKFYIEEFKDNRWALADVKFNETQALNEARDRCSGTGRKTRVLSLRCVAEFKESADG